MDKKSKVTIITSVIALSIVIITVTYAYFSARITGLESASTISLTAGTMGIHYEEGNEEVTLTNIYPKEAAWVTKTFTLTGNNTTDLKMNYIVGLDIQTNTFQDGYLFYSLENTKNDGGTPIANKNYIKIASSGKQYFGYGQFLKGNGVEHKYTLTIYFPDNGLDQNDAQGAVFNAKIFVSEYPSQELPAAAPENWYSAAEGTLLAAIRSNNTVEDAITLPGKSISFDTSTMVMTVPLSQVNGVPVTYSEKFSDLKAGNNTSSLTIGVETYEDLVGKFFSSPVLTQAYNINYAYLVECDGTNFTAAAIPDDYNVDEYKGTEKILASTEDDYGTSYYYRGAVDNNFVVFADMCWRIVRIDGEGNIKLTLYNYDSASCTKGTGNAFARYDNTTNGQDGKSAFNSEQITVNGSNVYNYSYNTGVGFMYSNNPTSSSFATAHANDNDSTILKNLKTWYDAAFDANEQNLLADTIWCNDKRVVSDTSYDPWNYSPILGTGVNKDKTYYQTTARLRTYNSSSNEYDNSGATPTLKCGNNINDNKISKFTSNDTIYGNGALNGYKIGLLTADEVAYAGAAYAYVNKSYYLYENASDDTNWWWLLSPGLFHGGRAYGFDVNSSGDVGGGWVSNDSGLRPAVSLKSTALVTGNGNGTRSNPYRVSAQNS